MELDFDKIYKISTRALNISGAHPYIPRDRKWALKFVIVHGFFYTLTFLNVVYNIIYHDMKANNFAQICKNGVMVVVYIVITFQYCVLLWHQDALVDLINEVKRDYEQSKDLNSMERDVLYKYVNLGVWVCKQWLVISTTGTGVFLIKNMILTIYYYCIDEFKLIPFYDLVYPSIIEKRKDNIYVYLLTYALTLLYGCYSALMYIAYVPLGPIFILHACGQLELVKNRIDNLFVECDDHVIRRKLKSIIVHLQYIYRLKFSVAFKMELDFDKIFKISTRALNITGAHPYIPRDRKWALQFFIVHGFFYTLAFLNVIYNIIYHDLKANNFSQICKNGVLFVIYVVITFQYCVLLWHQDGFVDLINNMKRDYEHSKNLNSIERDVIYKYVNLGIWVCKQWLVISTTACGVFLVKNIALTVYCYCIDDFKLIPFYDLVYPSFIEEKKDNIYVYLLTYALMLLYGSYSSLMYIAYVPLGPIFILHACGQLELVKNQIDDLFVECDDHVIRKKLKIIIVHLQYIYSFVDRIKQIFEVAYELTLKATTIMLPITCYEVIEAFNRGEVSLEFITFIVAGTLFSSSPCYYSDLLMEKGENVRLSLYTCGWERHYDRRTRTTLQLMLQNALRPIAIQTIFRVLCLEALTDLFQQSYAIFNLMNAMWG